MRVQLVPLDGGSTIDLHKELVVIGRREDCDIQLDHKSVSKIHCVLVRADGVLLLRDLGSTNGTRVNGTRVRRAALLPNDHLNIASLKYRVEMSEENSRGAAALPIDGQTQHIDPRELEKLLAKQAAAAERDADSDPDFGGPPVLTNALPDHYG